MNLKSKKFIVMLLVSSLLVLSSDLYAKKRGAQCSAGIDRSAPVAAYIALNQRNV